MDIKDSYLHGTVGVVKSISVDADKLKYKLADIAGTIREVTLPLVTTTANGLMSSADKKKLDAFNSGSLKNNLVLKINSGTTEGTNLYTYNGSAAKTLDIKNGTGIGFTNTVGSLQIYNSGVRAIATGTTNGTISVNTNGTSKDVAVKGLGSAAYISKDTLMTYQVSGTGETMCVNANLPTELSKLAVSKYIEYWDGSNSGNGWFNSKWGWIEAVNGFKGSLTGNASSATKFQTKRKLWGLDFDGTADVSGNMTGVGSITRSSTNAVNTDINGNLKFHNLNTASANYWHIDLADNTLVLSVHNNGNVGIGVTLPTQKLEVNGNVKATSFIGNLDGTYVNKLTNYKIATAIGSIAATDSLNTALGKLEFKTNFIYNDLFGTDNDDVINKWHEIVDFIDSVKEGTDITDEFVTRKTALTITGAKTFSNNITLSAGNEDRFLNFLYTGATGYDWRIGYLGSGQDDANYFVILSDKTNGTYVNALRIGLTSLAAVFGGTVTASKFITSGGTSSLFVKGDGSLDSNTYSIASHTHSTFNNVLTIAPKNTSSYLDALILHDSGGGSSEGARIRWTSGSYTTGITLGPNSSKTGLLINDTYTIYHTGNLPAYPTTLPANGGNADTVDNLHASDFVRAFSTSNDNIDSDWGQSFKTFNPIPLGTPPELNPNISLLSIGNNFNRRKLLAFMYNNDNIYYRRRKETGFSTWKKIAFTSDIPTVTNYYWANIKISSSSSITTTPTFATVTATTSIITPLISSSGDLILNSTHPSLLLKSNNDDTKSVMLNGSEFKPFNAANGKLDLGSSSARWKIIYGVSGNFTGHINGNYFTSNVAIGTQPYACNSTTLNTNLNADLLDGFHRKGLYSSIPAWINANEYTVTITVSGSTDTYYPVVISTPFNKEFPGYISVWKNLGSKTAAYSGNHSNGTSSMWLLYEVRDWSWDGNGGYLKCWYYSMNYAILCAKAEQAGNVSGKLVVYLRGGGTSYNISSTYGATATVYTEATNIGSSKYPINIAPTTTVTNKGIILNRLGHGYVDKALDADKWTTARTLTIGNTGKSVDGSANVSWSLAEIGASASTHTHSVTINGATKTIAASGGAAVDLGNYLPLSGGTMSGSIILKGSTSSDMTYAGNIHPYIRFDNVDSSQNVSLIFTDYNSYRSPAGIKLIGNQGGEWFEAPNIYAANFYGTLSGNASSATKLTSSAGSATLPIYFSDGKPVACVPSSLFSNLSNNENNLSITIAGLNRTLTVKYATSATTATALLTNNTSQSADACYSGNPGLRFWRFNGTGNNIGGGDGWIMSWSWNPGSVGGQIYFDDNPSKIVAIRGYKNDTKTFTSWSKFIHSDNYNSYSPKLDGTGASGTWNININGNASTASRLKSIIVVDSKAFSLSNASWTDTGYTFASLATGTYAVQVTFGTTLVASGIMSIYNNLSDTAGDEIPLHVYGTAGWRPYLRTYANKLLISSNDISATSRTITIKIALIL